MPMSYFRPSSDAIEKFKTNQHRPFGQVYYDTRDFQLMKKGWWLRAHYWNDQKKQPKQWSLRIDDRLVSEDKDSIEKRLAEENLPLPPLPYTSEPKRLMYVLAFVDGHQIALGNDTFLNAICCTGKHLLIGETNDPNVTAPALPPIVEIFTRRLDAYKRGDPKEQEIYDILTKRYDMSLRAPEVDIPGVIDEPDDYPDYSDSDSD